MIYRPLLPIAAALTLGACAVFEPRQPEDAAPPVVTAPVADAADADADVYVAPPPLGPAVVSAPPPPAAAKTQDALDTTTAAQRAEAAIPPAAASKSLGSTIASLGSPTEPGLWLKTPLVSAPSTGRVTNKANGKSSAVALIPLGGPATGGSQLSLPAMRLIGASVTDLTEIEVTLDS